MEESTLKDNEGRKVDFEKMNNARKRALYTAMWGEVDGFSIEKTGASDQQENTDKNDKTASSYRLSGSGDPDKIIINQFQIKAVDQKQFKEKYDMAVTGDGQEKKRITTLHSSSLCALLHFYNVTEKNPLALTIKGREIKFNDAVFEYKSPVIGNPSNMDVVLIGDNDKVVLFLECKFAEYYLSTEKTYKCSEEYRDFFRDYLRMEPKGDKEHPWYSSDLKIYMGNAIRTRNGKKEDCIELKIKNDPSVYLTGIKQMVAHHIGICNVINGNMIDGSEKQERINKCLEKGYKLFLGEILFDFGKVTEVVKKRYEEKYEALATMLNKRCERIHVLDKVLTYNEIFNNEEKPYNFASRIKAFYYGK